MLLDDDGNDGEAEVATPSPKGNKKKNKMQRDEEADDLDDVQQTPAPAKELTMEEQLAAMDLEMDEDQSKKKGKKGKKGGHQEPAALPKDSQDLDEDFAAPTVKTAAQKKAEKKE